MSWRAEANLGWLRSLAGVEEGKSLARHTSFNIGGPADFLVESGDAGPILREARRREIPARVIGAGTNLLVSDEGVEGLVVTDHGNFTVIVQLPFEFAIVFYLSFGVRVPGKTGHPTACLLLIGHNSGGNLIESHGANTIPNASALRPAAFQ